MLLRPDPQLAATVEMLKEAFESGRSIDLQIGDREAPLCGCVSHIHEGSAAGDYVFSAFVGADRIVIGGANRADELPPHRPHG
jgi:hypothetical protein